MSESYSLLTFPEKKYMPFNILASFVLYGAPTMMFKLLKNAPGSQKFNMYPHLPGFYDSPGTVFHATDRKEGKI